MSLFEKQRTYYERLDAAANVIAPYGFRFDDSAASDVQQYLPFREAPTPERYNTACRGRIEDAVVEGYEYAYSVDAGEAGPQWATHTLIVVQHRSIGGTASFAPDPKEWSRVAAALDWITWVPPFAVVKLIQWINESKNPDRNVGDAEFDRLYKVHAASDEAAREGLPPALRRAALKIGYHGSLETRPGLLLYSPVRERLDPETIVGAFGLGTLFLGAMREGGTDGHPMR